MMSYFVIGVIVGLIIGVISTQVLNLKFRKYHKVKRELEAAQNQLSTQKSLIIKHFSNSAEILDNMAKEFRQLYKNMAEDSKQFISQEDLEKIEKTPHLEVDTNKKTDSKIEVLPPKDYPGESDTSLDGKKTTK